ncbi:hypothetical protein WG70_25110 [Burkholderia oklahomensis EO147]|nr:hypothetical protein WG70_25110 [Burkholderia oklahomensis EO147]AOI46319.1 hypothetical protein WI23_11305 [Burkholderia oklahomensis C6786]KUY53923.1 hypothetical protein WI23_01185 [Burkholderia oklahomensis C6786]KUY61230.1 hypothetical protein WG70_05830 [Burkholderia oklahomensis EO147]
MRRVSSSDVPANRDSPSYVSSPSDAQVRRNRNVADGSVPSAAAISAAVAGASATWSASE